MQSSNFRTFDFRMQGSHTENTKLAPCENSLVYGSLLSHVLIGVTVQMVYSQRQVTEGSSVSICASLTGAVTLDIDVVVSFTTTRTGTSAEEGEGIFVLSTDYRYKLST